MCDPGLIILAAGGSTRMGSPKQLLPWKDGTLLRNACLVALETNLNPVIVVLGCEANACLDEIKGLNVSPLVNPDWKKGIGSSLAAGISHLKQMAPNRDGALIVLGDQPTVTSSFLFRLSGIWKDSSESIVATKYAQGGGVPAIFPRSYFAELERFDADQGARSLILREKSNVRFLEFEGDLIDVDDHTTYQKLLTSC